MMAAFENRKGWIPGLHHRSSIIEENFGFSALEGFCTKVRIPNEDWQHGLKARASALRHSKNTNFQMPLNPLVLPHWPLLEHKMDSALQVNRWQCRDKHRWIEKSEQSLERPQGFPHQHIDVLKKHKFNYLEAKSCGFLEIFKTFSIHVKTVLRMITLNSQIDPIFLEEYYFSLSH